jgi:hypothetical protein
MPTRYLAVAVVLAHGCVLPGGGGGSGAVAREVTDAGRVCLYAALPGLPGGGAPQQFVAGEPVFVVHESHCLSSSCSRDVVATCTVAGAGTTRQVTSTTSWLDLTRPNGACTADCGFQTTTCSMDALDAGTYTFAFGMKAMTLVVPSETATPPCVDIQPQL